MRLKRFVITILPTLLLSPVSAWAAIQGSPDTPPVQGDAGRLEIGIGAGAYDSAYRNYDEDTAVLPLIFYDGSYFYIEGGQVGFKAFENSQHRISVMLEVSPEEWDAGDSDAFPEFEDRDKSFNAGLAYRFRSQWGIIKASVAHDISDDHEGVYGEVSYAYPWHVTQDFLLLPGAYVKVMSSDFAEYYYGITDKEADRVVGVDAYDPGSSFKYGVQLIGNYRITPKWGVLVGGRYTFLDSDIEDSPMLDDDTEAFGFVGVTYKFW